MSNSEIQQILSKRFDGYSSSPTADSWSKIEAILNEDDRRRKGVFFWCLNGLAAASILALIGYSIFFRESAANLAPAVNGIANSRSSENKAANAFLASIASSKVISTTTREEKKVEVVLTNDDSSTRNNLMVELDQKLEKIKIEETVINVFANNLRQAPMEHISIDPINPRVLANNIDNHLVDSDFSSRKLPRNSRWEVGVDASGFVNSKKSNNTIESENTFTNIYPPSTETTITVKHVRFVELRAFVQRQFGRRIIVGAGLSTAIANSEYSKSVDTAGVNNTYSLTNDYWTLGIPVHTHYSFFQKNRWNVYAGGMIQPEFRFARTKVDTENGNPSLQDQMALTATLGNEEAKKFRLGYQPYIGTDFYASSKVKISLQTGFRSYLFRSAELENLGMDPNYFTASIGVSWHI